MITFALVQDFVIYSLIVFTVGIALGTYVTVQIVAKTNTNRFDLSRN